MNLKFRNIPIVIGLLVLAAFTLQACASSYASEDLSLGDSDQYLEVVDITEEPEDLQVVEETSNNSVTVSIVADSDAPSNSALSAEEIDSLIFMREEEKLARDVYLALYDLWGLNIFNNIAKSEQTHMDAVLRLLEMFDIPDPADTSPAGVFENADLQDLYDDLVELGSQSLGDALKVGAAIEEIDILDLDEYLEIAQNSDIREVFTNLRKGSENHLRAFTSTLEKQTGEVYSPQYLSEDEYHAILTAANGRDTNSSGQVSSNQKDSSQRGYRNQP